MSTSFFRILGEFFFKKKQTLSFIFELYGSGTLTPLSQYKAVLVRSLHPSNSWISFRGKLFRQEVVSFNNDKILSQPNRPNFDLFDYFGLVQKKYLVFYQCLSVLKMRNVIIRVLPESFRLTVFLLFLPLQTQVLLVMSKDNSYNGKK